MNADLEIRDDVLGNIRKQSEITTLLMQQQSLSLLPKREIPIYDGDPLKYHLFIRAFENGVENNTTNSCDRLYFLEQHTMGHAKELVRRRQLPGHPGHKDNFASTVGPVENKPHSAKKEKDCKQMGRKACIFCGGGHALDMCVQMGKMAHEKKIGFLKENGICFGLVGHISKRISCSKCSLKHPTVLHKEPVKDSEQTDRSQELHVNSTLV